MGRYRLIGYWIVAIFGLIIQTALLPNLFPVGYVPDLLVPLVVILAFYETPRQAMWIGLGTGVMQDVWSGRMIGLNALTLALVGWGVAALKDKVFKDAIFVPAVFAGTAELFAAPLQWLLLRVFGYVIPASSLFTPLPYWVVFSMLVAPAIGGILALDRPVSGRFVRARGK